MRRARHPTTYRAARRNAAKQTYQNNRDPNWSWVELWREINKVKAWRQR